MMDYLLLIGLLNLGVTIAHSESSDSQECDISLRDDLPEYRSPLYIRTNKRGGISFVIPDEEGIILKSGEKVTFACIGRNNYLKVTKNKEQISHFSCSYQQLFNVRGTAFHSEDITCHKSVQAVVQRLNTTCIFDSRNYVIGYPIDDGWLSLIHICYNKGLSSPLYTIHNLFGPALKSGQIIHNRPLFRADGTPPELLLNQAYLRRNQFDVFSHILGSKLLASSYIANGSFLARGHYSPVADFPFATWKYATFFYINAVPQWQNVNNGNWKTLERLVRQAAIALERDFIVITGSYGILKLDDAHGNSREMYLGMKAKIPIPQFLWKVVIDHQTLHAIGFLALNNPFVDDDYEFNPCKNICNPAGFYHKDWKNPTKGLLRCCEVEDMANIIITLPKVDIRGILVSHKADQ